MKKAITVLVAMILISLSVSAQQKAPTDTTKKQPEPYFLMGTLEGFQLLFKAISSPDDVTKNESKILSDWIRTGVQKVPVADSTKVQGKK